MDPRKLPALELLRLCLESKDEAAWTEFVHLFQPFIARVVAKTLRTRSKPPFSLIDDLVQDTFVKLCLNDFRALRAFDCRHENALFGFVKKVASNVVEDYFRRTGNQKRGSGREEEELDPGTVPAASGRSFSDSAERRILIMEINRCLESQASEANFPRDCLIFWLYYEQGFTAKAISELPGINLTVKGVESTLLRLIRLVREKMNAKPDRSGSSGQSGPSGRAAGR